MFKASNDFVTMSPKKWLAISEHWITKAMDLRKISSHAWNCPRLDHWPWTLATNSWTRTTRSRRREALASHRSRTRRARTCRRRCPTPTVPAWKDSRERTGGAAWTKSKYIFSTANYRFSTSNAIILSSKILIAGIVFLYKSLKSSYLAYSFKWL